MTTYTAIPDSDIDPESPGTTTLFTRLRDNPIAITEGAAGAPSVANAALAGYPFSIAGGDISDASYALIESWTPTATTDHVFTWDETLYSDIIVAVTHVRPATNGVDLLLQFGYSNGGTIITSANYKYSTISVGGTAIAAATAQTSIKLNPSGTIGNSYGVSSSIRLSGLDYTTTFPIAFYSTAATSSGAAIVFDFGGGTSTDSNARTNYIDSVKILWSSGNFTAAIGNISVYGLIRS